MSYESLMGMGWSEIPSTRSWVPFRVVEGCRVRGQRPICVAPEDLRIDPTLMERSGCVPDNTLLGSHKSCTTNRWTDSGGNERGGLQGHIYCCPPGKPAATPVSPELRAIILEEQAVGQPSGPRPSPGQSYAGAVGGKAPAAPAGQESTTVFMGKSGPGAPSPEGPQQKGKSGLWSFNPLSTFYGKLIALFAVSGAAILVVKYYSDRREL